MTKTWMNLFVGTCVALSLTACPSDDGADDDVGETAGEEEETAEEESTSGEETTEEETTEEETTTEESTSGEETTEEETTEEETTEEETTEEETGGNLSFETDAYPVIMANCSCHVNGGPAGLAMPDAATAYANLVDVDSMQEPGTPRVAPGDPMGSYIVHKIQGTASAGGPMPPGGSLSSADEMAILDWIADGANP